MNQVILGLLIGFGSGLIIFPILLGIYKLIKNTLERRKVKKMIKKEQFLVPIDKKDYNVQAWQNQRYGNINPKDHREEYEKFNEKMFRNPLKEKENRTYGTDIGTHEEEPNKEFMGKIGIYVSKMKQKGYSNEDIIKEFRKKNYSEVIIRRIFEQYG